MIVIGLIIYLGTKYQIRLEEEAQKNFELFPVVLFATIFPVVIGILLRLPKFMIEMKQNKRLLFDWVKFIAIALPSLYILAMSILPYSNLGWDIKIPEIIITGSPTIQTIAGVVFGYILLDSLRAE